jgi:hypothetical protein
MQEETCLLVLDLIHVYIYENKHQEYKRRHFDSLTSETVLPWETLLGIIPTSQLLALSTGDVIF